MIIFLTMKWWFTICRHSLDKYSLKLTYQFILVRFKIKSIECHLAIKRIYFLSETHFLALAVSLRMMTSSSQCCTFWGQRVSHHCANAVNPRAGAGGWMAAPTPAAAPAGLWAGRGTRLRAGREPCCRPAVSVAVACPPLLGTRTHLISLFPCASESYRDGERGCLAEKLLSNPVVKCLLALL